MTGFDRAQLVAFVRAVDRHLDARASVLVVGGAAAALAYHSKVTTADIDVMNVLAGSSDAIGRAGAKARQETGLGVAIGAAGGAELPYDYEDRVRRIRGIDLENLTLLVPDKYDLALSKALHGYPHDIDAIESIHRSHRLSKKTLLQRFEREPVNVATADPAKIRLNVVMVVARLYGIEDGRALAQRWRVPTPPR